MASMETDLAYELYMVKVTSFMFAGCITLIIWEYLLHLPAEISIHRERKYGAAVVCLLIVRYSTLAAVAAALPFVYGNPPSCAAAAYTIEVCFWIMQTSVQAIFYLRTCAMCRWENGVRLGLGLATVASSACWLAAIFALDARDDIPDIPYGGKCFQGQSLKVFHVMGYLASCGFDFIVLVITLAKVWQLSGNSFPYLGDPEHRISAYVLWQTVAYFFPVFCANFSAILLSLVPHDFATRSVPVGYTFAVSSVAAARMVFQMRESLGVGRVARLAPLSRPNSEAPSKASEGVPLTPATLNGGWRLDGAAVQQPDKTFSPNVYASA